MNRTVPVTMACAAAAASPAFAQLSNIEDSNKHAWCENIGFTNWRDADGAAAGVRAFPTHLVGAIWAGNAGWVRVGTGPADGVAYANTDSNDYGINVGPAGTLSGYAWGENIGWVNFGGGAHATPGSPARIDTTVPPYRLRGHIWGENVGWINLDDADLYVGVLCVVDYDGNAFVNGDDFDLFVADFEHGLPVADVDGNTFVNGDDFDYFVEHFVVGC